MEMLYDVPLSRLTTMRLGGTARRVVAVASGEELQGVVAGCLAGGEAFFVLGGGSNVIGRDAGFEGTVILNRIKGFTVAAEDGEGVRLRVGAGENWDEVVARSVAMGLSGIEALSAIPGTAGATPVQNVGAYGQEIAQTLVEVEALETASGRWVRLSGQDCGFSYRNSIFKDPARRQHIIAAVSLRLRQGRMEPPFYGSLQRYFEERGERDFSPGRIRQAVMAIRREKLPDPARVANAGSFFKNPIVAEAVARRLAETYPDMPQFTGGEGHVKLAAGWLIERAGLKGFGKHGFATSADNALVVINESGRSFAQLEAFAGEIIERVRERFGVRLEQEPETL